MTAEPAGETTGRTSVDRTLDCLAGVAVDAWRLSRLFAKSLGGLAPIDANRMASQLRFLERSIDSQLSDVGVRLVGLDGRPFDAGLPATPVNADTFGPDDELYVEQTITPVVMGPAGLLKQATVMLARRP